jgi:RNA polymerase sigma-70 factor (ECF subfamily)
VSAADRKLVRRCLTGDAEALRTLVETYQGSVFGLCFRMVRHRQDAEDITQEVLVRAVRSLRSWDRKRPLRPWILAIAANRCRTHLAKQVQRPLPVEHLADLPDERPPERDKDLAAELDVAIAALRPEYRLVVVMYHEQELPYEEISEVIGRPVGTVKTWLHRARAEMAKFLTERATTRHVPADRIVT